MRGLGFEDTRFDTLVAFRAGILPLPAWATDLLSRASRGNQADPQEPESLPMSREALPALSLVPEADPEGLLLCQMSPSIINPTEGTVAVRYSCARCGVTGAPAFGPGPALLEVISQATALFDAAVSCPVMKDA